MKMIFSINNSIKSSRIIIIQEPPKPFFKEIIINEPNKVPNWNFLSGLITGNNCSSCGK